MKRGHVMGNKRERKPANPWWAEDEERRIQAIERESAESKTQFLADAATQGIGILYHGSWANLPDDIEERWAQAARHRAAAQYGPADTRLCVEDLGKRTTMQEDLRVQAQQRSIAKGLAVRLTSPEGETSQQYFQSRTTYEDFVARALHQGYTVEALTCASS